MHYWPNLITYSYLNHVPGFELLSIAVRHEVLAILCQQTKRTNKQKSILEAPQKFIEYKKMGKIHLVFGAYLGKQRCKNGTQAEKCAKRFTHDGISWPHKICKIK